MKMNHRDALSVLGLKAGSTFEEIKLAYRKACAQYHPDRNPAGLEMMKVVNAAYQALSDYTGQAETDSDDGLNLGEEINRALNAIINLGLTIEVCGSWIWVSGDTRPHKDVLKEAGYRWAPKKMMWSFAPSGKKTFSRGQYTIDEIRSRHGSVTVKSKSFERLSA